MSYTVRTSYSNGYVVEIVSNGSEPCSSWILLPAENLWPEWLRGILYVIAIVYMFLGVAIASDIFMGSIEVITSKKRKIIIYDDEKKETVEKEVMIWNETVANLTLMALGSSAPEILLATVETFFNLGDTEVEDSLGAFTIIGSAAFNLLIITSICIVSLDKDETKKIREFGVFLFTAIVSMWAYVWMLLVVRVITPGEISVYEAWLTLAHLPVFVFISYLVDTGCSCCRKKKIEAEESESSPYRSAIIRLKMSYPLRTFESGGGYVVEYVSNSSDRCESWLLVPGENLWHEGVRGFLYILATLYLFLGVAIASDIFMNSIEVMTSKTRTITTWDEKERKMVEVKVMIWNETVANLTLMALGSSAPEILLAVIESFMRLGDNSGEDSLGTFTIIGSAAFNLLIITSVCIVSCDEPKKIKEFGVFIVTAIWSMFAYIWMLLVVGYITPEQIDVWEAWVTLGFMPVFVFQAYCQDNGWWRHKCCPKNDIEDSGVDKEMDHIRIMTQHGRKGSFAGHALPGKELHVLEVEKAQKMRPDELQINGNDIHSVSPGPKSANNISLHLDENSHEKEHEETPEERLVKAESGNQPKTVARARFRHAVVSAMTGAKAPRIGSGKKSNRFAEMALQVSQMNKAYKEGKMPTGDLFGKFTFASDRYAVLESAGKLEIDILFHRNLPYVFKNGDSVGFTNGATKPLTVPPSADPSIKGEQVFEGVVTVEFETREGSGKAGKDFKYKTGTLTFKENEFKQTISVEIINDNQFENDCDFYLILKNPVNGASLGDPSITRVTIVDDDEPGEFQFEESHVQADLKAGKVLATVIRENGIDGKVTLEYSTIDGSAVGGKALGDNVDYINTKGTIEFKHAETSKNIEVKINKDSKGSKNFIMTLKNPSLGAKIGQRGAVFCHLHKETVEDRIAAIVKDEEEEEVTWAGQFRSALTIEGSQDEDGNNVPPSCTAYLLHFLTFFWKLLGACVPPATLGGAWPAFVLSLVYIGGLTACIEQLGHLIGCVIGLKTSVTGITIIALGTSLPDTFASRTAAKQDETADAAIGNVTGSNSVNVFLGLGLPWVISTSYALATDTTFKVSSGNLTQSVIIFASLGTGCIIILILRRFLVGGELGGKNKLIKWGSSILLLFFWLLYIVLASLKAYDILKFDV
ncbi:hypothetical protein FSP39_001609 [Pinctada imbricata]|uniref:Calx-beta domain-containing protein n=1 Tax=Pinctada imbricata TaxID=66713 RepID=A0AA88YBG3_PINIB|nr:hypothetical protein FSP39_001609 [Pinctada imbricata]